MTAFLLVALAVVLLVCAALTWVVVIADRALKSRARRLSHQAERLRSYRAELTLLTEAYDRLVAERRRAVATAALDVTAELPLPPLDARTLRQMEAVTPADFDTPGETR